MQMTYATWLVYGNSEYPETATDKAATYRSDFFRQERQPALEGAGGLQRVPLPRGGHRLPDADAESHAGADADGAPIEPTDPVFPPEDPSTLQTPSSPATTRAITSITRAPERCKGGRVLPPCFFILTYCLCARVRYNRRICLAGGAKCPHRGSAPGGAAQGLCRKYRGLLPRRGRGLRARAGCLHAELRRGDLWARAGRSPRPRWTP